MSKHLLPILSNFEYKDLATSLFREAIPDGISITKFINRIPAHLPPDVLSADMDQNISLFQKIVRILENSNVIKVKDGLVFKIKKPEICALDDKIIIGVYPREIP